MNSKFEFFVGYLAMPAGLKRFVKGLSLAAGCLAAVVAALLVTGQHPFAPSTFEFQQYRDFDGTILSGPYPALAIAGEQTPWLLVAPGKHGAAGLIGGLEGKQVHLKGERIFRDEGHMIEILPDSIVARGSGEERAQEVDLGEARLTGEIVDSKCFFGVMNPGNGKVHRDCAVRCISGGVPPAFLVRDSAGRSMAVLLAGEDNRPLHREVLDYVAERITIRGRLVRVAGTVVLRAEPRNFARFAE